MGSRVIAIIEDDAVLRRVMSDLVSFRGYRTELYASAEEFIGKVAQSKACCLLIDVQLEDITGVELSRHLSSLGFTLPVIFMTANDDYMLRKQATDLGCIAYLLKPVAPHVLFEALAKAVGPGTTADNWAC